MTDTAVRETNIAQVSIQNTETDYDIVSLTHFLKKNAMERTTLITSKRIEFVDYQGNKIPLLDGLKAITALMRRLREEGTLITSLPG